MISSVNCHSTKILEYDDYHLRPIVWEIPSYIKETSDFLCTLKPIAEVPENSYCVTSDLKSYYTSIPNSGRGTSSKYIPWKLYEEDKSQR